MCDCGSGGDCGVSIGNGQGQFISMTSCGPNAPPAFTDYSDKLRRQLRRGAQITRPLVDTHPPDDNFDGAFQGTVGVFQSLPAIQSPLGPWFPDYMGIVPVTEQQQIVAPEPWTDREDFNG